MLLPFHLPHISDALKDWCRSKEGRIRGIITRNGILLILKMHLNIQRETLKRTCFWNADDIFWKRNFSFIWSLHNSFCLFIFYNVTSFSSMVWEHVIKFILHCCKKDKEIKVQTFEVEKMEQEFLWKFVDIPQKVLTLTVKMVYNIFSSHWAKKAVNVIGSGKLPINKWIQWLQASNIG